MKLFQAEFDASELITQRELVSQRINQFLGQRCATFGLILDDISIVSKAYQCFMTNRRVFKNIVKCLGMPIFDHSV